MPESAVVLFALKLVAVLASPLGLTLALLLGGGALRGLGRRRLAAAITGLALAVLWISATPVFASWALGTLERQYPS
jgi:hypothetical protein